jgi:hypothetical protein
MKSPKNPKGPEAPPGEGPQSVGVSPQVALLEREGSPNLGA